MCIFFIYAHLGISIQDFFYAIFKNAHKCKWMEMQLVSFYKSYNESLVITYSSSFCSFKTLHCALILKHAFENRERAQNKNSIFILVVMLMLTIRC